MGLSLGGLLVSLLLLGGWFPGDGRSCGGSWSIPCWGRGEILERFPGGRSGSESSFSSNFAGCTPVGPPYPPFLRTSVGGGNERLTSNLVGPGESKGSSIGTGLRTGGLGVPPDPGGGGCCDGCGGGACGPPKVGIGPGGGNGSDDGNSGASSIGAIAGYGCGLAGGTAGSGLEGERTRPAPIPR